MKWYKISALIYREFRVFKHMKYKAVSFFYFPFTAVVIWGLFFMFVRQSALEAGLMTLIINIFWSFAQTAQNSTNISMMEDSWSGSLKHIFVSGVSGIEYLLSRIIVSTIFSIFTVIFMISIALFVFDLNILITHSWTITSLIVITLIGSIALAIFVAGAVLKLGREYGFLSWTAISLFILLSAPFYPVSIFPEPIQYIAWLMPFTQVFEGIRQLISANTIALSYVINGAITVIAYLVISVPFYKYIFEDSKRNGNLVRMGT